MECAHERAIERERQLAHERAIERERQLHRATDFGCFRGGRKQSIRLQQSRNGY